MGVFGRLVNLGRGWALSRRPHSEQQRAEAVLDAELAADAAADRGRRRSASERAAPPADEGPVEPDEALELEPDGSVKRTL